MEMAELRRSIMAQTPDHARGAAESLVRQGFSVEAQQATWIVMRKKRRRGDEIVTIMITEPTPQQGHEALPPLGSPNPTPRQDAAPQLYRPPSIPAEAPRSPDGRWWWDGQNWRPTTEA
jgi:hypothetical protein